MVGHGKEFQAEETAYMAGESPLKVRELKQVAAWNGRQGGGGEASKGQPHGGWGLGGQAVPPPTPAGPHTGQRSGPPAGRFWTTGTMQESECAAPISKGRGRGWGGSLRYMRAGRIPDPLSFPGSPWLIPAGWRGCQGDISSLYDWRQTRVLGF